MISNTLAVEHANATEALIQKMEGAALPPPAPEVETPPISEPEAPAAPVVAAPKPAAPKAAAPAKRDLSDPKVRLARSMEIQRRANQTTANVRAATKKLTAPKVEEPQANAAQADLQKQLDAKQAEIANIQNQLNAEVRLARTNPMEFAKRHGVSPAALADFVAKGSDPMALALEDLRREASQAIKHVRDEAQSKISALQDTIIANQEVEAQRNFFTFVEESKEANPDAFAALHSGLVMSDLEVWDTANRLLETRKDLRDDFDEDKLLEAVEAEARKDPRWKRVQALTGNNASQKKPNVSKTSKKPNASEQVETETPEPSEETETPQVTQSRATPTRDPRTGQFEQRQTSPFERHQNHVNKVMSRFRLGA